MDLLLLLNPMPDFLIQGALCDLSIVLIVGFVDGLRREFDRYYFRVTREDFIRRGYIV